MFHHTLIRNMVLKSLLLKTVLNQTTRGDVQSVDIRTCTVTHNNFQHRNDSNREADIIITIHCSKMCGGRDGADCKMEAACRRRRNAAPMPAARSAAVATPATPRLHFFLRILAPVRVLRHNHIMLNAKPN